MCMCIYGGAHTCNSSCVGVLNICFKDKVTELKTNKSGFPLPERLMVSTAPKPSVVFDKYTW